MTQDYSSEAQEVADALNAVYENKQTNKKNSLDGDYSSDNASYPTCKAVKSAYGTKKTSWAGTPSDDDIPSEKLVKDSLDGKASSSHDHDSTYVKILQTSQKGKNVVVDDTTGEITFETKPAVPTKTSDLTNDGSGTTVGVVYLESDSDIDASNVKDSTAHSNIGSSANDTQASINSDVDTALGNKLDKQLATANRFVVTDSSKNVSLQEKLGNITLDGKIGSDSGKIITTTTNGVLQASSNISTDSVVDGTAHTHIGSNANATQSTINTAIDSMLNLDVVKQSTADTGYASTYYITQNGTQVGSKIQIEKDKMLRSISVETVGSTPTTEESSYNMTTGDQYILMIVNTVDNDGTSRIVLPITDVFDLQTADESTLTLSSGGVFSIKSGGVDTTQLKNGAVTSDKIATAVKDTWLSASDVESEISAFASALAEAINPSSP